MMNQMTAEMKTQTKPTLLAAVGLVFFLPLAVYLVTLCPTVYGGDSGELIAAAYTLGIAHIPGHPLYVLLGKLFSYLPVGSIAWRLNFMSAFFAALALAALMVFQNLLFAAPPRFSSFKKSTRSAEISQAEKTVLMILAVLAFGCSETFWHYATTAETYTGGVFFFAVLLIFLIRYDISKDIRLLYGFSFIFGLSLGYLLNNSILIPAFLFWIFSTANFRLRPSHLAGCALLWFLGLSIYGFVLFRMTQHPAIHFGNPDHFSSFFDNLMAGSYRRAAGHFSVEKMFRRFAYSASWFLEEFRYGLVPFIIAGAVDLARHKKRMFLFSAIVTASVIAGTIWAFSFDLSIDKKSYYLPIYLLFSLFLTAGFIAFRNWSFKMNVSRIVFYGVLAAVLCFEFAGNYKRADKHDNYLFYDVAKATLETAGPNSVLFLDGEWLVFPMIYLRAAENVRPDLTLYDRNNNVFDRFYRFSSSDLESNLKERDVQEDEFIVKTDRPVYFTKFRQLKNAGNAALVPDGLLYRVVRNETVKETAEERFSKYAIRNLGDARFESDPASRRILAHYYFLKGDALMKEGNQSKALETLKKGESLVVELYEQFDILAYLYYRYGFFDDAVRVFKKEIAYFPDYAPTYKNIGILYYEKLNNRREAKEYFKKYLQVNPEALDRDVFLNLLNGVAGGLG